MRKILFLFVIGLNYLFALNVNNIELNESLIKQIVDKNTIKQIENAEKKAKEISKTLKPISYAGFKFYSPEAKQMIKKIDEKFKMCLKDKKYRTNTGFCHDTRFKNLQKLKEFDEKQIYFLSSQIYNLRKQKKIILNSIIMEIPQYKKYRKLKLQCMKFADVNKVKECYKKYYKEFKKLNNEIIIIKEKIINKLKKIEKKSKILEKIPLKKSQIQKE